jgi:hypothetical protein
MLGRLVGACVAALAALAALGFAVTSATLVLAQLLGAPAAMAVVTLILASLGYGAVLFALRTPSETGENGKRELLAVSLARNVVRSQPITAIALCGALGVAAARRPAAAAEIGRGVVRLMLT